MSTWRDRAGFGSLDHLISMFLLEQTSRWVAKAVPQRMHRHQLVDPSQVGGGMAGAVELSRRHRLHRGLGTAGLVERELPDRHGLRSCAGVAGSLPSRSRGGSCREGGLQLLIFRQDALLFSPHPRAPRGGALPRERFSPLPIAEHRHALLDLLCCQKEAKAERLVRSIWKYINYLIGPPLGHDVSAVDHLKCGSAVC